MKVLLGIIAPVLVVAYPLAVYFGLSRFSVRTVGLFLIALSAPVFLMRIFNSRGREHLLSVLPVPLTVVTLLVLSSILQDRRFILALPVLISVVLLVTFGSSLRSKISMVERFARMQRPDLPEDHVDYCRSVTWMWCGFFVVNGTIAGVLAVVGPLTWWTFYTGLLAYILMGVLFAGEYIVRKHRFREYGSGLHDRLLAAIFPPETSHE